MYIDKTIVGQLLFYKDQSSRNLLEITINNCSLSTSMENHHLEIQELVNVWKIMHRCLLVQVSVEQ